MNFQLEQNKNSEQKADDMHVCQRRSKPNVIGGFVVGDRVVWDSHFGYEIGYFIGEGVVENSYLMDVMTGVITGECSYSKDEIHV